MSELLRNEYEWSQNIKDMCTDWNSLKNIVFPNSLWGFQVETWLTVCRLLDIITCASTSCLQTARLPQRRTLGWTTAWSTRQLWEIIFNTHLQSASQRACHSISRQTSILCRHTACKLALRPIAFHLWWLSLSRLEKSYLTELRREYSRRTAATYSTVAQQI